MRTTALALLLLCSAPPAGWQMLSAEGLSISLPPNTSMIPFRSDEGTIWMVRNARFEVDLALSPTVGDKDDAEPSLCYTRETLRINGRDAVLRLAKENGRLDCPERYASLYMAPVHAGGAALFVSGSANTRDDLALVRAVIASIHISGWH